MQDQNSGPQEERKCQHVVHIEEGKGRNGTSGRRSHPGRHMINQLDIGGGFALIRDNSPSSKGLPAKTPRTREGFLLGMRSLVSLNMLYPSVGRDTM